MDHSPKLNLVPWSDDDLYLLERSNAEEMTQHLGGPQPEASLIIRHHRYLQGWADGTAWIYGVDLVEPRQTVGSVGYWQLSEDPATFEMGWAILPEYAGRGYATAAAKALLEVIRSSSIAAEIHAYPSSDHPASNAICRKAGFTLLGTVEHEFPKGSFMTCSDWIVRT